MSQTSNQKKRRASKSIGSTQCKTTYKDIHGENIAYNGKALEFMDHPELDNIQLFSRDEKWNRNGIAFDIPSTLADGTYRVGPGPEEVKITFHYKVDKITFFIHAHSGSFTFTYDRKHEHIRGDFHFNIMDVENVKQEFTEGTFEFKGLDPVIE